MNRLTLIVPVAALLTACAAPSLKRMYSTTDPDVPEILVDAPRAMAASFHPDGSPVQYTAEQLREATKPQLSPAERKALKVFGWCSAADAATTIFALHRGAVELNPILGPSPSAGALVASKVIFNVGAHALIVHGDGEWAPWVKAAGWMQCGAAAWNLALAVTL